MTAHPTPDRPRTLISAAAVLLCAAGAFAGDRDGSTAVKGTPVSAAIKYTAVIEGKEVPAPEIPMGDPATTRAIIREGRDNNKVMEHLKHLTKNIGPRLTGSTRALKANEWTRDTYQSWGLSNVQIEQWGEIGVMFDRGPSSGKVVLKRDRKNDDGTPAAPEYRDIRTLEFSSLSWTAGTNGAVRGPIIKEPRDEEEYKKIKDKLKGAWILLDPPASGGQRGVRSGVGALYEGRKEARKKVADGTKIEDLSFFDRMTFDGVAGWISTSRDERVWTGSCPGWRELTIDKIPQDVHVTVRGSDYDFINSRLYDGEAIEVEFNMQHTFTAGPAPTFNTIAEIPGTDLANEVVIISAHMDSWDGPGSEGCTDNGTGTCVTLEAARILKAVGAQPRRTIRFIHWTGEEQGLLGSRGYVQKHPEELSKISCVFVDDGGTNYEGGLPCIESMVPMLAAATAPVNNVFFDSVDKKPLNVNIHAAKRMPRGGASDHASFNAKKVPGFFWDEVGRADYGFGWHTQNDTYDRAISEYLMQSSTCAAVTAYRLACAPTMLPREEEEKKEEPATGQ